MKTTTKIRQGNKLDMPAILALIQELAEFENALSEVSNTIPDLTLDFSNGWFEVLVAEDDTKNIIGMAMYHKAYSSWKGKMIYLDDLIVKSEWRGKGIGNALLNTLVNLAQNRHVNLIKWQVLDWNDSAVSFYEKLGVIIEKDWWNCKYHLNT
jgi:GNAT superfamily N-acetyltransferase